MARTADQIVAETLGNLQLQVVVTQARVERAEEREAALTVQVGVLEEELAAVGRPEAEDAQPEHEDARAALASKKG